MQKMAAIIVFGLIITLGLAGFAAVEAASINGYTDNRRNTASNFDQPSGEGFAEYYGGPI